jgi:hypothetical protein
MHSGWGKWYILFRINEVKRPPGLSRRRWKDIVTYRPVVKRWFCKQRPLLGNAYNMHATTEQRSYATARWTCSRGKELARNNRRVAFSMLSTPRSYLEDSSVVSCQLKVSLWREVWEGGVKWPPAWDPVEGWQLSRALQRRLRKDGVIVSCELTKV